MISPAFRLYFGTGPGIMNVVFFQYCNIHVLRVSIPCAVPSS